VSGDQVEQVKGVTYTLSRFLGPKDWIEKPLSDADEENTSINTVARYSDQIRYSSDDTDLYHAVIYLAPGDYHRFHSPTEWNVYFRRYFPGLSSYHCCCKTTLRRCCHIPSLSSAFF
jgi:phosphatidylserine decarboxylase